MSRPSASRHRVDVAIDRGVFMISVAAELAEMHPQTLRMYEARGLIEPSRSPKGTRLYSQADVERLRRIQQMTVEMGLNLAGVERVLALEAELDEAHARLEELSDQAEGARRALLARARRAAALDERRHRPLHRHLDRARARRRRALAVRSGGAAGPQGHMSAEGGGAGPPVVVASRARRALAGTVDGLTIASPQIGLVLRRGRRRGAERPREIEALGRHLERANVATGLTLSLLRELGMSPGSRLAGIATGRRADGRRIPLWRAVVITAIEWSPTLISARATAGARRRALEARRRRFEELRPTGPAAAGASPRDRPTAAAPDDGRQRQRAVPRWVLVRLLIALAGKVALRPLRDRAQGGYTALRV